MNAVLFKGGIPPPAINGWGLYGEETHSSFTHQINAIYKIIGS